MSKMQLISQFLKSFSFESPNAPELFFQKENGQAKMDINLDIQIKGTDNNLYMVDLIVKLHSKLESGDKSIFLIDTVYTGLVQVEETKDEAELKQILLVKVPELLFPEVRSMVLHTTSESGFPPFSMQQIDFQKLHDEKNSK